MCHGDTSHAETPTSGAPACRTASAAAAAWAASHLRRSLAETQMMRLKTIFSDKLKAREWRRQETELRVRCAALNRMTALGMPHSYAV